MACQEPEDVSATDTQYFVSVETATQLANNRMISSNKTGNSGGRKAKRKLSEVKSISNEEGEEVYHIMNFEGGGFMIVSADSRREPVLAYSDKSTFDLHAEYYPSGLVNWLGETGDNITNIRKSKRKQAKDIKKLWTVYLRDNYDLNQQFDSSAGSSSGREEPIDPIDPNDCLATYTSVLPLLSTTWSQGKPYNNQAPYKVGLFYLDECPSSTCCQAYTGCVATAMAQVLRYHEYPNTFNWSIMPDHANYGDTGTGVAELARLMRAAGDAVEMDWGCTGSGANTKKKVPPAFRNYFGYSSATHDSYKPDVIVNELNANRPVILRGYQTNYRWFVPIFNDGHAWVCDGYKRSILCTSSILYLHMNWGWGETYDEWYGVSDWTPGDHNFQYDKGMIYNIKP